MQWARQFGFLIKIKVVAQIYRVSIKSFPDYKHLLEKITVRGINYYYFFQNVNQEIFLQHISTLQHVLLFLRGERLIDNQFLSTCSPTCLQLL